MCPDCWARGPGGRDRGLRAPGVDRTPRFGYGL